MIDQVCISFTREGTLDSRTDACRFSHSGACGYLAATVTLLSGLSATASPTTIVCVPMQLRYHFLLSSEKTTSSPTAQSGTATTVFTAYGAFFMSITRNSPLPSAVT